MSEGAPKPKTAPDLRERVLAFKSNLKERRDEGGQEDWRVGFGEYYQPLVGSIYDDPNLDYDEMNDPDRFPIYGVEKYFFEGVKRLLESKKPVILVDFGGMRSLSFLRIAKELEKDGHISNGDVAIVVTNLNFDPNGTHNDINKERLDFFNKYKSLVHFVNADAREIQKVSINVSGNDVSLKGNVDFVHESWALTHGTLNDVDWLLLARMLADGGQLVSKTTVEGIHPGQGPRQIWPAIRSEAHRLGVENMLAMGLKQKNKPSQGTNYDIFEK